MKYKKSAGEILFDIFNYMALAILVLACLYPIIYVFFGSISDPLKLIQHTGPILFPQGFTLVGYQIVLRNPNILTGYTNTLIYVIGGTTINIFLTSLAAYALSRKRLMVRKQIMLMIVFTMYFSGGIIPRFLLVQALGMYDTRWAIIIPAAIMTWNLVVMRTSFAAIPDDLEDSARIDGANDFVILFRIIMPVAKATVAVMVLFYSVMHWNSWFRAMIYLRDRAKFPLQLLLREILIGFNASGNELEDIGMDEDEEALVYIIIRYCTIIVSTLPILMVYPFAQKYFIKGVMIGSIKG